MCPGVRGLPNGGPLPRGRPRSWLPVRLEARQSIQIISGCYPQIRLGRLECPFRPSLCRGSSADQISQIAGHEAST